MVKGIPNYILLSAEETQSRIDELIEDGWTCEEVTYYRVYDNSHILRGQGDDEDEAWDEAVHQLAQDELYTAKKRLAKWNAAVVGKAADAQARQQKGGA